MLRLELGFAVAIAGLVLGTGLVAWYGRLGTARSTVTAAVRAAVQLGLVSLVIVGVLRSWGIAAAFAAVMLVVAWVTSARRVGRPFGATGERHGRGATGERRGRGATGERRGRGATGERHGRGATGERHGRGASWAGTGIVAGVAPTFAVVLLSGSVPLTTVALVPILGILIGGAMTATSLAGRRAIATLRERYGEYEAALALGFSRRAAALEICRPSAADALVPALDQTRTVGLVTLPGAFVGVLLGGGSPIQAGAVQLLVLVGLLAAESVAVLVTVELVANGTIAAPSPAFD